MRGGVAVPLQGPKDRALLAHLVARVRHTATTDELAETLWGELPPRTAHKALQNHVVRLRRLIEPEAHGTPHLLLTDPGGYRLDLADDAIDARRFEAIAENGRRAYRAGRVHGAAEALRHALALWRGHAYLGLESTSVVDREARRLHELRMLALEDRLAADLDLGRAREVVGELSVLVESDPFRERLWYLLVLALYRADRQADSLDACRRARATLVEELGTEPGQALREIELQVLRQDPVLDIQIQPTSLPAALVPQPGPLVGRDAELNRLRTAWQAALGRGSPARALITGSPGAGVGRLGAELAAELADRGTPIEHCVGPAALLPRVNIPTLTVIDLRASPDGTQALQRGWDDRGPRMVVILARGPTPDRHDPHDVHIHLAPLGPDDAAAILACYRAVDPHSEDVSLALELSGGLPGRLHELGLARALSSATARVSHASSRAQAVGQELADLRSQLRDGVTDFREAAELAEPVLTDVCPWRGLSTYEAADSRWFAGRERVVAELLALVASSRFVAVVGSSGSGKSSLLRAGLLASLQEGALPGSQDWPTWVMRPGRHPLRALRTASGGADPRVDQVLDLPNRATPVGLAAARTVLVVDQFEELWTACDEPAERTQFVELLLHLLDPSVACTVVVAVRADHVGSLADHPVLSRALVEGTLLLGAPSAAELERMITRPAARAGLVLDDGLADALVEDATSEPGALPLLSTALQELWELRQGRRLTLASHVAGGGLRGAVARLAEGAYHALDDEDRAATRKLLLRLAGSGQAGSGQAGSAQPGSVTRRRVPLTELAALPDPRVRSVVEPLSAARLLTVEAEHVEVAHEALFREWPRLRAWLDERAADRTIQRRLSSATTDWVESGRDPTDVWRGSSLVAGLELLERSPEELTVDELAFLAAGRDRIEAERRSAEAHARDSARQNRRLRGLLAASACLLAVASVAGMLAVRAQDQAEANQASAQQEARIAQARELAAAANSVLPTDPELSVLLATRAVAVTRDPDGRVLHEAEEALHRAVAASRIVDVLPGMGGSVALSPDGAELIPEGPEGSGMVEVHDAGTGELLRSWRAHSVDINEIAISPNGTVVAAGDDGAVTAWDLRTGRELGRVSSPGQEDVYNAQVSSDGSIIAAGWSSSQTVRVHDVGTGTTLRTLDDLDRGWVLALSPDGASIAVAPEPGRLAVFEVASGRRVLDLAGESLWAADIAWSPDGQWIAGSIDGSGGRIWDARTGELVAMLVPGHTGYAPVLAWSPDSTTVATAGHDGTARVWRRSWEDFVHVATLSALSTRDGILGLAFSPDSRLLYASGFDVASSVTVFDVSTGGSAEWATVASPEDWTSLAYSPDGAALYVPSEASSARVVDPATGRTLDTIGRAIDPDLVGRQLTREIEVSPQGHVAMVSEDGVRVTDPATGEQVLEYTPEDWWPTAVAWNPDGSLLAVGGHLDGHTVVLDLTGEVVGQVREEDPQVPISVAFSPDGSLLAVGRTPNGVQLGFWGLSLWDWRSQERLRTLETQAERVLFTADGLLVNADRRGPVLVSDPEGGAPIARLTGHTGGTLDLDLSRDGARLATVGRDGTVRVWDTATWTQLLALPGHTRSAMSVRFSPDGGQLASLGEDGRTRVWAMDLEDLLDIARDKVTRAMSPEECLQYLHATQCA
jgi:WD40 repeat protein/DNA-binding SARP family transcriptional activator